MAVSGAMMTPDIGEFGLKQLDKKGQAELADHWMMHPWQAMQILNYVVEIESTVTPGVEGWSFLHVRVVEDTRFPQDLIQLRDKDENVLIEFRNVGSIQAAP